MGCTESQEKLLVKSLAAERESLKKLEMELRSQVNMYEFEISNLKEQVKKRENQENHLIVSLKSELDSLVDQLNSQKSWKSYQILKNLIRNYREVYHYTVYWGFAKWKHTHFSITSLFDLENNELNEEIIAKEINTEEANKLILQENKCLLAKSIIRDLYSKNLENSANNMALSKVVRLFEDMMDLKYSQDLRDIEEKRKPKGIPEFMIDFLNRSFGLKNLANKNLSQIVPTLIKNSESSNYLALFCRLLHVHISDPVGYTIGLFLIRTRIEFNNLINSKGSIISKFAKNTQNTQKLEGGWAFLSDTFNLIYNMFDKSRFTRSIILSLLKPESMSKEHYFLFHISFKMSRVPISPEELYDLLDIKKEGSMLNRTLIQGIVRQLDLWISSENIETIYSAFDSLTTGKVTKDCFVSKLSPKTYFKNSISEKYMISKCQFLEAILELYNKVRLKTTALLMSKITETMLENIDGGIFKELVRSLDPSICEDFCEYMFEEIQNQDSNRHVAKENLVKTLVEYGIGDKTLKSFGKE